VSDGFGGVVRSVFAVFAGLLTVVILSEGTDFVLRSFGVLPPLEAGMGAYTTAMLGAATAYRTLAGVVGGYVTASLAPARATRHALVLGGIGTVLSVIGLVVMWGVGPAWYPIALAVLAMPSAWLGGRLRGRA
jgi:hypothetical protein